MAIALLTAFLSSAVRAQELAIVYFEMPDSVALNGTAKAIFRITNQSTQNQLGNLRLWFLNTSHDSVQAPLGGFETLQLLAPGQTRELEVTIPIEPQHFIEGGNTVVIWPSFVGQEIPADSLLRELFVLNPNSQKQTGLDDPRSRYLVPNPVHTVLSIQAIGNAAPPQRIIVRDLAGKECLSASNTSLVNIGHLPAGIYFVQLDFSGGQNHIWRIIKAER